MAERDIYIAIMRAAARGEGLRLSADECFALSLDDAIATRANNTLDQAEFEAMDADRDYWKRVNPRRKRTPFNGSV